MWGASRGRHHCALCVFVTFVPLWLTYVTVNPEGLRLGIGSGMALMLLSPIVSLSR